MKQLVRALILAGLMLGFAQAQTRITYWQYEFPTRVEVTLAEGPTYSIDVEMPVGSLAAPLSDRQYTAKFGACAERFIPPGELAELMGELRNLPDLASISPVMSRLAQPWAPHG